MRRKLNKILSMLLVTAMVCTGNISTTFGATQEVKEEVSVVEEADAAVETEEVAEAVEASETVDAEDDKTVVQADETDAAEEATDESVSQKDEADSTEAKEAEVTEASEEKADAVNAEDEEDVTVEETESVEEDVVEAEEAIESETADTETMDYGKLSFSVGGSLVNDINIGVYEKGAGGKYAYSPAFSDPMEDGSPRYNQYTKGKNILIDINYIFGNKDYENYQYKYLKSVQYKYTDTEEVDHQEQVERSEVTDENGYSIYGYVIPESATNGNVEVILTLGDMRRIYFYSADGNPIDSTDVSMCIMSEVDGIYDYSTYKESNGTFIEGKGFVFNSIWHSGVIKSLKYRKHKEVEGTSLSSADISEFKSLERKSIKYKSYYGYITNEKGYYEVSAEDAEGDIDIIIDERDPYSDLRVSFNNSSLYKIKECFSFETQYKKNPETGELELDPVTGDPEPVYDENGHNVYEKKTYPLNNEGGKTYVDVSENTELFVTYTPTKGAYFIGVKSDDVDNTVPWNRTYAYDSNTYLEIANTFTIDFNSGCLKENGEAETKECNIDVLMGNSTKTGLLIFQEGYGIESASLYQNAQKIDAFEQVTSNAICHSYFIENMKEKVTVKVKIDDNIRFHSVVYSNNLCGNKNKYVLLTDKWEYNEEDGTYSCTFLPSFQNGSLFVDCMPEYETTVTIDGGAVDDENNAYHIPYNKAQQGGGLKVSVKSKYKPGEEIIGNPDCIDVLNSKNKVVDANLYTYNFETGEIYFDNSLMGQGLAVRFYVHVEGQDVPTFVRVVPLLLSTPIKQINVAYMNNKSEVSVAFGKKQAQFMLGVNNGADVNDIKLVNPETGEAVDTSAESPVVKDYVKAWIADGVDSKGNTNKYLYVIADDYTHAMSRVPFELVDARNTVNAVKKEVTVVVGKPAWANSKVAASVVSTTDVEATLKLTAPNTVDIANPEYENTKYVYMIKATPVSTAGGDSTVVKWVDAVDEYGDPVTSTDIQLVNLDFGEGHAAKFNIEVLLLYVGDYSGSDDWTTSKYDPDSDYPKYVYGTTTTTVIKNVSTKNPAFAEKITLKKTKKTSFYVGDNDIVATVDFGGNTTYNRAADWEILGVYNSANEIVSTELITAEQDILNGVQAVKINVVGNAPTGKYKVKVATKLASTSMPVEAALDFTVLDTVGSIAINDTETVDDDIIEIYKYGNKDITVASGVYVKNQTGNIIKSAKLEYAIGKVDGEDIVAVPNLTVDKNGKIKVGKNFSNDGEATYKLKVKATTGNISVEKYFEVSIEEVSYGLNKLYYYDGEEDKYKPLPNKMKKSELDNIGILYLFNKDNEFIGYLHDLIWEGRVALTVPTINKAGKVTITATAVDGTKASATTTITSVSDVLSLEMSKNGSNVTPSEEDNNKFDVTGDSTSQVYNLKLVPEGGDLEAEVYASTLSVTNAKIVKNNYNNQDIDIVLTKSPATIKQMQGRTVIATYTITNDLLKVAAPKLTAARTNKLYANYGNEKSDDTKQTIMFTLKTPMNNVDHINVSSSNDKVAGECKAQDGEETANITASLDEDNKTLKVEVYTCNGNINAGSYPLTFDFVRDDGSSLCPTVSATVKFEKYAKTIKLTNSYSMSYKDQASVALRYSGPNVEQVSVNSLMNANIKGTYSNFASVLKPDGNGIAFETSEMVTPSSNPLTGYVNYTVTFKDKTTETYTEKITVKFVDQVKKYSSYNIKTLLGEANGSYSYKATVIADKSLADLAYVTVYDEKTEALINDNYKIYEDPESGATYIYFNPKYEVIKKTGTYNLIFNIITNDSWYANVDDDDVTKDMTVPVVVKLTVVPNNTKGKCIINTKIVYSVDNRGQLTIQTDKKYQVDAHVVTTDKPEYFHVYGRYENGMIHGRDDVNGILYFTLKDISEGRPRIDKETVMNVKIKIDFEEPYGSETYTIKVRVPADE